MSKDMPVQAQCDEILQQPCPYKFPPLMFLNGHSFCPCICKAIRAAYIGGYKSGRDGIEPEVGLESTEPNSQNSGEPKPSGSDATDGITDQGC